MIKQLFDSGWEFTDQAALYGNPNAQWTAVTLPHDYSITRPRSKDAATGGGGGLVVAPQAATRTATTTKLATRRMGYLRLSGANEKEEQSSFSRGSQSTLARPSPTTPGIRLP